MRVYFISFLLPLLSFGCILCNIIPEEIVHEKGGYTQWREKLGFLPGDLSQKVDPYLRPLYDGIYEMLGLERATKLIEKEVIEVAPLAYLRGRTLNNAFIIMDESQNTTVEQMKMVLTRIGYGSQAVINGDLTQIDLPKHITSGLDHVIHVLKDTSGIGSVEFSCHDVIRHPLVRKIIDAYKKFESNMEFLFL